MRQVDQQSQRLDRVALRLGRPSERLAAQRLRLAASAQALKTAGTHLVQQRQQEVRRLSDQLPTAVMRGWRAQAQRLEHASLRLNMLDPMRVLERGYAWLSDEQGDTVHSCSQAVPGQHLTATLVDGTVDLTVGNLKF
jgi:exodeoxyribonuclease VII large subunit